MATIVVSIVTFVVGGVLGHRLALGRDRRKEFNEAAQPILTWLLEEEKVPSPFGREPSLVEIDMFVSCMRFWKRSRFNTALGNYRSECRNTAVSSVGDVSYQDPERVRESVRSLLPYTKRR